MKIECIASYDWRPNARPQAYEFDKLPCKMLFFQRTDVRPILLSRVSDLIR